MGMFSFLEPKPKMCQSCGKELKKLHKYNTTYYKDKQANVPKMLCTDCLLNKFKADLSNFKGRIVFEEPIMEEGYCFTKFVDEPEQCMREPLKTFIVSEGTACNKCSELARFTWVNAGVVKEDSYGVRMKFKNKEEFSEYKYFCLEHLVEEFAEAIKKENYFFMEFWPPKGEGDGYCF